MWNMMAVVNGSPDKTTNWPRMVEDLVARTSKTQLAARIGVNFKEIGRWIKGAKPQNDHADALREACVYFGLNLGKYEGLRPIYAFGQSFDQNKDGPEWLPPAPVHELPKIDAKIWHFRPDAPLGISACVLTANSNWIGRLSRFGFEVIEYKTVRSRPLPPHGVPNLALVPELVTPQAIGAFPKSVLAAIDSSPDDIGRISLVNSFGMPSDDPNIWQKDIQETRNLIAQNQVLIVSVVGTAENERDLIADFVRVAKLAAETPTDAIELNFSCPNVYGKEGSIYNNPELAAQICKKVVQEIRGIKLVVKIGYLPLALLRRLFEKIYRYVDGIAAINTMSAEILSASSQRPEPFFPGEPRKRGGVSGIAIKEHALAVVRELRGLANELKPELVILGMGGAAGLADVKKFIESGANCVQMCTAVMFNPLVAVDIRRQWSGQTALCGSRALADSRVKFSDDYVAETIARALEVARDNSWPAEDVLDFVQNRWVRPYKEKLALVHAAADAPVKARGQAPTAAVMKTEYLQKLNAKFKPPSTRRV